MFTHHTVTVVDTWQSQYTPMSPSLSCLLDDSSHLSLICKPPACPSLSLLSLTTCSPSRRESGSHWRGICTFKASRRLSHCVCLSVSYSQGPLLTFTNSPLSFIVHVYLSIWMISMAIQTCVSHLEKEKRTLAHFPPQLLPHFSAALYNNTA